MGLLGCECDEVVMVKGTGERIPLGCGCHFEDEAASRPSGIRSETVGGVSVTYADPPMLIRGPADMVVEPWKVPGHPGFIPPMNHGCYEVRDAEGDVVWTGLSRKDAVDMAGAIGSGAWYHEVDESVVPLVEADRKRNRMKHLKHVPAAVPLVADPELAEGLTKNERQRWLAKAAADFETEPMMPVPRRRPGRELFPDRHPRLHRFLRRFALYRERQLRRLDGHYERVGTDPGRRSMG